MWPSDFELRLTGPKLHLSLQRSFTPERPGSDFRQSNLRDIRGIATSDLSRVSRRHVVGVSTPVLRKRESKVIYIYMFVSEIIIIRNLQLALYITSFTCKYCSRLLLGN